MRFIENENCTIHWKSQKNRQKEGKLLQSMISSFNTRRISCAHINQNFCNVAVSYEEEDEGRRGRGGRRKCPVFERRGKLNPRRGCG